MGPHIVVSIPCRGRTQLSVGPVEQAGSDEVGEYRRCRGLEWSRTISVSAT